MSITLPFTSSRLTTKWLYAGRVVNIEDGRIIEGFKLMLESDRFTIPRIDRVWFSPWYATLLLFVKLLPQPRE